MRVRVNDVLVLFALAALVGAASRARADEAEGALGQPQWVPSLAVTSGVTMEWQSGSQESFLYKGSSGAVSELRPAKTGNDLAVSPYIGGALELMTPALPIFPRLRLFATGEVLPTFAPE